MGKIAVKILEMGALVVLSLISDIKTYKIKNCIVLPFIPLGVTTSYIICGRRGVLDSLWGTTFPILVLFAFYALRMIGAGDIKLFSAIGAVMGARFVLYSMAFSFIAGGVMSLAILSINRKWEKRLLYLFNYLKCCFLTNSLLPYSDFQEKSDGSKFHFTVAITCGVAVSLICLQ